MNSGRGATRLEKIEKNSLIRAIRGGLVLVIPVLMVGSFALILRSFPLPAYLTFIQTFAGGALYKFLSSIYNATFGLLSVYMTFSVSYCLARESKRGVRNYIGTPICAVAAFLIAVGFGCKGFKTTVLGPVGMFSAIVCATLASYLYLFMCDRHRAGQIFSDGSDVAFSRAIVTILPLAATLMVLSAVNLLLCGVFHVDSFWALIELSFDRFFLRVGDNFLGGFLYIVTSSLLWFFGIHGSDVLESVNQNVFIPAGEINMIAASRGVAPPNLYTKTFFDVFVLIGGCGTALALLLSLFLFSKRKSNRSLAKFAAVPMLFNINEILVFGLPVIYNPSMLVPFILAPLVSFLIASGAMSLGLVPYAYKTVEWTTPIFLGGYQATGSAAGAVLQGVNLVISTLIYMPFVFRYDRRKEAEALENIGALVEKLKASEISGAPLTLTEMEGLLGDVAKQLANDLEKALKNNEMYLLYQPQYEYGDHLLGAEALLRWKHPVFGLIYPPLIIKLATEAGFLTDLERHIFSMADRDVRRAGIATKISINVTVDTIRKPEFSEFLTQAFPGGRLGNSRLCIEITEQSELITSSQMLEILKSLKQYGFLLAIDDFSMGHTSLKYLRESDFDIVKLDGALVKGLVNDAHTKDIIASIIYLSRSLNFRVLAEFVETEEQRDRLAEIGCLAYQGYLYSPAISMDDLKKRAEAA